MTVETVPTPALVIDAERVRGNIAKMAEYCRSQRLNLRPHTKTHKSVRLAKMQLTAGACGVTVAKVGEAKVMSEVADDLLMAYPAVQQPQCTDLAKLATTRNVAVGIDSVVAANHLSDAASRHDSTIGILIDIDVGYGRTGVQTADEAVLLATHIDRLAGLRLDGIMYFPGHVKTHSNSQLDVLATIERKLANTVAQFKHKGLCADTVSGGSTPTATLSHKIPSTTEIRPGTYIFNDMNCVHGGYVSLDDCAARIHCTVVSNAVPGQVVIDAGSKTLTSDPCGPAPDSGFGYVVELPEAKIKALSEEHGQIDVTACSRRPQVGERLTVIPNHICPCVNLQDKLWWYEPDDQPRPIPVDARGRIW